MIGIRRQASCNDRNDCKKGQECRYFSNTSLNSNSDSILITGYQQCVWPCKASITCPGNSDCISGICQEGDDKQQNLDPNFKNSISNSTDISSSSSSSSSEYVEPATVKDHSFQTIFFIFISLVVASGLGFFIYWFRRRQMRIHRFHTLVNTARTSIIETGGTTGSERTAMEEQRNEGMPFLNLPAGMSHDIIDRTSLDEVVRQTTNTSHETIRVGVVSTGVAIRGDLDESGAMETNVYVDNTMPEHPNQSTDSIDMAREAVLSVEHEPYKDLDN
ncbi:hypothetical protein G9A89_022405 [Geosiphon pyriformis]|nr:hypothetical protein G9A89_022405 [Geosiphon pyriformis]